MNKSHLTGPRVDATLPAGKPLTSSRNLAPEFLQNANGGLRQLGQDQDAKKIQRGFCNSKQIVVWIKSTIVYAGCNGWIPSRGADWMIQKGGLSHV